MASVELERKPSSRFSRSVTGPRPMAAQPSGRRYISAGSHRSTRESTASSRRSAASLLFYPFGFDSKVSYNASEGLQKYRSENFEIRQPEPEEDIWKKPPPDFRPQVYAPRPPKRNSRDAMKPWRYASLHEEVHPARETDTVKLPHILRYKQGAEKTFVVSGFDIPDACQAKVQSIREETFHPEEYATPKPHDFRGYPPIQAMGLPEFATDYERDPSNINFLSQRLNAINGLDSCGSRVITGRQMAPPMSSKPHYEPDLILPLEPFPNKYQAYTRFRIPNRSAKSALMERISDALATRWRKEKFDIQCQGTDGAAAVPEREQQEQQDAADPSDINCDVSTEDDTED